MHLKKLKLKQNPKFQKGDPIGELSISQAGLKGIDLLLLIPAWPPDYHVLPHNRPVLWAAVNIEEDSISKTCLILNITLECEIIEKIYIVLCP